jgi:hypothetical protein
MESPGDSQGQLAEFSRVLRLNGKFLSMNRLISQIVQIDQEAQRPPVDVRLVCQ